MLSNFENDNLAEKFKSQIDKAKEEFDITLSPISFEQLIGVLENVETSDEFQTFLTEFRDFLERNNHLPNWKYLLDVVNCSGSIHEVHDNDIYMCPDTGGMYKHQRAKYFGGYKNKNVKYIHEVKALVVVEKGGKEAYVRWNNGDAADKELIKEAKAKINLFEFRKSEINERNLQVFLLENKEETNFRKSSSGGLYGSKKYFRNIAQKYDANNSRELAEKLKDVTWD